LTAVSSGSVLDAINLEKQGIPAAGRSRADAARARIERLLLS